MGTWGYNPHESDAAAALLSDVLDPIARHIARIMHSREARGSGEETAQARWERIGMLSELVRQGVPVDVEHLRTARAWLRELRRDGDWLQTWTGLGHQSALRDLHDAMRRADRRFARASRRAER